MGGGLPDLWRVQGQLVRRAARDLLVVELAQGVIGYVQYFTGLPIAVVLLHMLGAALITVATARLVWSVRGPANELDHTVALRATPRPGAVPLLRGAVASSLRGTLRAPLGPTGPLALRARRHR